MKNFDIIITNPPYQAEKKNGPSLWPEFIRLSYNFAIENVIIVVPNRWGGPGSMIRRGRITLFDTYIRDKVIYANMGECDHHFPDVGPGANYFSYFILDKHRNDNRKIPICTQFDEFEVDFTGLDYIPIINANEIDFSIIRKIQEYNKKHGDFKFYSSTFGRYRSTGRKRIVIGHAMHANWNRMPVYYDDGYLTDRGDKKMNQSNFISNLDNNTNEENVNAVFHSKLYSYFISKFFINDVNKRLMETFPHFDLTRYWTDKEMYDALNLTKEEIDRIESYE